MIKNIDPPSYGRFSVRRSLTAIAFLAMLAFVKIASAHEMGSVHYVPPPIWPYHALLMSTGFVFIFAGMATARYMKGKKWWLKTHKNLGITGALLTAAGFIVAVYMVSTYLGAYFINGQHEYIGITAVAFVVFTPIIGFMQLRKSDKRMRIVHRWSGRLAIAVMLINAVVGWIMISAA